MPQPMLFSPLEIRGMHLRNRVVVAPMHQYSAVEGFANDWHLVNAGKFAQGGAGLVIMESTKVARNGAGTVGDVGLWDDQFIAPLARCAAFIKAHGARAGIQLGHSGRKARLGRPWEGGKPLTGTEPGVFDRWFDRIEPAGAFSVKRAGSEVRRVRLFRCVRQLRPFPETPPPARSGLPKG